MNTPTRLESERSAPVDSDSFSRTTMYVTLGAAGFILLVGVIFGGLAMKIVATVIALAIAYGWWLGFARIGAFVGGLLLAFLLAPLLGRAFEGVFIGLFGTSGIVNRLLSITTIGVVIIVAATVGGSFGLKRLLRGKPHWRRVDRVLGAACGAVEGVLISLAILWVPIALQPIAAAQLEQPTASAQTIQSDDGGATAQGAQLAARQRTRASSASASNERSASNPLAARVVWFASKVRESAVARAVSPLNPIADADVFTIVQEFSDIANDEIAMELFMDDPDVQRVRELPSVQRAMDILQQDKELIAMLKDDGLTRETFQRIVRSDAVLQALDQTSVVDDVSDSIDSIRAAAKRARDQVELLDSPSNPERSIQ